ncbi:MAG: LicD family protein [Candidatus Cloacimonetes bacterium]|nr:LicD family protein [Candidatus Cloacimonadota bacterium]MCF7815085.1 LicD family protein [Candidatus Cloacimonadota bacterium]MCF7868566.1 LicD family protein [Candidatus Cloacimonadota bacterium]MCF7884278.1 LicD family protein [Candidatus Cloacimonadota bacterium]
MPGPKKLVGKYARIANKMLQKITEVMEEHEIPYILEAGTLLGIVRENRLLPWDDDVDITIRRHDSDKFLRNLDAFRKLGYKVRVKRYQRNLKYFKKGELRMIKIKHFSLPFFQSDVCVDVFVKKLIGAEYYWTVGVHKPVLKSVPRRFYDELGKLDYNGKKYSIPEDYKGYLTEHYGNWQTPVKEWNFKFDDKSVKEKLYEEDK